MGRPATTWRRATVSTSPWTRSAPGSPRHTTPIYPDYGQFTPLEYDLTDGRTLSYLVLYEGSRQAALAMLQPLKAGAAAPVLNWRLRLNPDAKPPREPVWRLSPSRKFNAFVVAPNLLLAAGQEGAQASLTAFRLENGASLWEKKLPAAPVKGGLASDHQGRILVSLGDGRTICYGPGR